MSSIVKSTQFPIAEHVIVAFAKGTEAMCKALYGPHRRNTLEQNYRIHRMNNQEYPELVNKFLGRSPDVCDPSWEKMRQTFVIENLPLVGNNSFADYAKEIHK